ncbi:MAG TPA: transcriptional regulator [Bacteroidetes bacterium]|nr:transcriptional regulator [Bacteroidota bacterium]
MIDRLKMEKRAISFREKHGLGYTDPIKHLALLDQLKVVAIFKPMSNNVSGMAIKVDEYRFMLINSEMPKGRQHFTIGHELYHLFEQENFIMEICDSETFSKANKEEYLADLFSSHLCLPNDGMLACIPEDQMGRDKISLETILNIEHYYKCSRTAVLYRLKELGLLSEHGAQSYKTEPAKSAISMGYSADLYFPANQDRIIGNDYILMAETLFEKNLIREVDFLSLLKEVGDSRI